MQYNKNGTLIINATSAGGALPTSGTVVRIIGSEEENRDVQYSIITDVDGISERITLPAPPRELSLSPGSPEPAYALYNIEISAPGFYTKKIFNVAVFDGEETVQPINMRPLSRPGHDLDFPRGNLNTVVKENELLE